MAVVILAAGQGTRMNSAVPKVLHPLAGIPLIGHVVATAEALDANSVSVVVRHAADDVAAAVSAQTDGVVIVHQDDVPGTGRAVEVALESVDDSVADVVVLSADVPLLDSDTVRAMAGLHRDAGAAVTLGVTMDGPERPGGDDWLASGMGFWVARRVFQDHGGRLREPSDDDPRWVLELPSQG